MAEKITLKNALANLPQKTDVDSIVARDASGNPVYIKKSDLAQVVAGLIGTASASKSGLLSNIDFKRCMQYCQLSTDKIFKIGQLVTYKGIWIQGIETVDCITINILISLKSSGQIITANKPSYIELKADIENNIYISVPAAHSVDCIIYGPCVSEIKQISDFPSDAFDI